MRLMYRFTIPVEKGNETAADGSMPRIIQDLVDELRPEAAYFFLEDGRRAGLLVFEETDQTRLVAINEPLFAKLHAAISIQPVMNFADMLKTLG
ncbi:MAG: hypothetical protein KQJ78_07750 [Deltaproteobacteria bacterium]|nr:hypothetical protein [Deltaproteobacteria bacterium]MCB2186295.1 hypothetical protein [Deltaproteobacteria bacterium]